MALSELLFKEVMVNEDRVIYEVEENRGCAEDGLPIYTGGWNDLPDYLRLNV